MAYLFQDPEVRVLQVLQVPAEVEGWKTVLLSFLFSFTYVQIEYL